MELVAIQLGDALESSFPLLQASLHHRHPLLLAQNGQSPFGPRPFFQDHLHQNDFLIKKVLRLLLFLYKLLKSLWLFLARLIEFFELYAVNHRCYKHKEECD